VTKLRPKARRRNSDVEERPGDFGGCSSPTPGFSTRESRQRSDGGLPARRRRLVARCVLSFGNRCAAALPPAVVDFDYPISARQRFAATPDATTRTVDVRRTFRRFDHRARKFESDSSG